jgi:glycosyltransferase involved in cell wall biosynthesis
MKHILLIDSSDYKTDCLEDIFLLLVGANNKLSIISNRLDFYKNFKDKTECLNNFSSPFRWLRLRRFIKKNRITKIIMLGVKEKISFSHRLDSLNLEIIWLEVPEEKYLDFNHKLLARLAYNATGAKVICLSSEAKKQRLDLAWPEVSLSVANPAFKFLPVSRESDSYPPKHFSGLKPALIIGTVVELSGLQRIEEVLKMLVRALELGCPIQLVVIGSGSEKDKIAWLVKKMGIDNLVWLVGDRKSLSGWYSFFDVFMITSRQSSLADLSLISRAGFAGLPILAENSAVLADYLVPHKNCEIINFEQIDDSVAILLNLAKNKTLRQKLGEAAGQKSRQEFSLEARQAEWLNIIG